MSTTTDTIFNALWTQTWQIVLLILIVALITRLVAKRRPHLGFVLWAVVFIKCVAPPVLLSPVGLFAWDPARTFATHSAVDSIVYSDSPNDRIVMASLAKPSLQLDISGALDPNANGGKVKIDDGSDSTVTATAGPAANFDVRKILIVVWLAGVLFVFCYAVVYWIKSFFEIQRRKIELDPELEKLANQVRSQLGFRRQVRVVVTESNHGPMAFGFFRPTIILPAELVKQQTKEQLMPILAHEIIHVRRGDTLLGLLQFVAQAVWWFNPLVSMANKSLNQACEASCDLEVMAELQCPRAEYARSLLSVVELGQTFRPLMATIGIRNADVTGSRLRSIMDSKASEPGKTPVWCWALAIAATVFVLPCSSNAISPEEARMSQYRLAETAWSEQDWDAAVEHYEKLVESQPTSGLDWFRLAYALFTTGKNEQSIQANMQAAKFPKFKPYALYNWACALALLNEKVAALDKLEEAMDAGLVSPTPIEEDADFANLIDDERFKKLAKRHVAD